MDSTEGLYTNSCGYAGQALRHRLELLGPRVFDQKPEKNSEARRRGRGPGRGGRRGASERFSASQALATSSVASRVSDFALKGDLHGCSVFRGFLLLQALTRSYKQCSRAKRPSQTRNRRCCVT